MLKIQKGNNDEKGTCTGEIGKINHGAEKVNRLKHWINENKINLFLKPG